MDSSLRYTARDLTAELPAAEYIARFRDAGRIGGYCRACPNYGRSWGCPPFGFDVDEYLAGYASALLVATKIVPETRGIPISESGRLIRPERLRLEARLLEIERLYGADRSPTSERASIAPRGAAHAPRETPSATPTRSGLRSKRADSTSPARPPNCSAST